MIDLHTHLDLYSDALGISDRVDEENLFTLAVTTSPRAWIASTKVFQNHENIKVALGMHPNVVCQKINELDLLLSSIQNADFIGEVGIDGSASNKQTLVNQEHIFRSLIQECEKVGGRVISIHSRGAESKILSIIKEYPFCGTPILHWFSGSITNLEEAIKLRCYFSVNARMLNGKKGRELVSRIPSELVLPESDGPFVKMHGMSVMPWEAMDVRFELSNIWNVSPQEARIILLENFDKLLYDRNLEL